MIEVRDEAPLIEAAPGRDPGSARRRRPPPGGRAGYLDIPGRGALRVAAWMPDAYSSGPAVLFLNGRRSFIELFYETYDDLLRRGFPVFTYDMRSQGLSERPLPNPQKGHIDSFDTYMADLFAVIDFFVAPRIQGPLYVIAHSLGGHVAFRALQERPGLFARAALLSPMFAIYSAGLPQSVLRALTRLSTLIRGERGYAFFQADYAPDRYPFEGNRLTSDPDRFNDFQAFVDAEPALLMGGVTNRWLIEAFRSMTQASQSARLREIRDPLLILSAEKDRTVDNRAHEDLAAALPTAWHETVFGARHEMLKEADPIQARLWARLDRFFGISERAGAEFPSS